MAQDDLTIAEVDEALNHAKRIPIEDRGAPWWAYVNGLLEQRRRLEVSTESEPEQLAPTFSDLLR